MLLKSSLPIIFSSQSTELSVELDINDSGIKKVVSWIDSRRIEFIKNSIGVFVLTSIDSVDHSFLESIALQVNRTFGGCYY